jgi:hypothetical protein
MLGQAKPLPVDDFLAIFPGILPMRKISSDIKWGLVDVIYSKLEENAADFANREMRVYSWVNSRSDV